MTCSNSILQLVDEEESAGHLRGLMEFNYPENGGIPIEEVERGRFAIVKRFQDRCDVLRLHLAGGT